MKRAQVIELLGLYWPIFSGILLIGILGVTRRESTALLFATLWNLATLPALNFIAQVAGHWSFRSDYPSLAGLPVSLWLGWSALWGLFFPMMLKRLPLVLVLILAAVLDFVLMPMMKPVLALHDFWMAGEILVLLFGLLPGLLLFHATVEEKWLGLRVAFLACGFGLLNFHLLPLAAFGGDQGKLLARLGELPAWGMAVALFAAIPVALPGLLAARDFVRLGEGTPVPLDPPRHLVTTGIYGRIRNPMQFSFCVLLLMQAILLANLWLWIVVVAAVVYSTGFAHWSEGAEMERRFGQAWLDYRKRVNPWIFRGK